MKKKPKQSMKPPSWADSLLEKFCVPNMLEELQGDLYELFYKRAEQHGLRKAKTLYWIDIIRAIRFFTLGNFHMTTQPAMIRSYLKSSWRSIKKNKLYTFVNVTGLGIGLASFILVLMYVREEYSYDKFHPAYEKIHRVSENRINEDGFQSRYASSFYPLAERIKEEIPGVEETVRIYQFGNSHNTNAAQVTNPENNSRHIENGFYFVDSSFFDVFGYKHLEGNVHTSLSSPFTVLVTQKMLEKYFGGIHDVVGKTLLVRDDEDEFSFTISGVVDDPPKNSHFQFDFLASFNSLNQIMPWMNNWEHPAVHNYIKLAQNQNSEDVRLKIAGLSSAIFEPEQASSREFVMTEVTDIHLNSHLENELGQNGNAAYINLVFFVALMILFIASINFMNLATANASVRVKEMGVRKTLGARKRQLVEQFLSESFVITVIAFGIALVMVQIALPLFNGIVGQAFQITELLNVEIALIMGGVLIAVSCLSGAYPAYFLSSFRTVYLLKGSRLKSGNSNRLVRRGLVVFQFTIACILIVAALVVNKQIEFLSNKDLGFETDQLLTVPLRDTEDQMRYIPLKNRWLQIPSVEAVTASSGVPTKEGLHEFTIYPEEAAYDSLSILTLTVDPDFGKVYDLEFIEGRDFSDEFATDATEAVVINESAAKKLGWEDPIGRAIQLNYYYRGDKVKKAKVVGLVKDFNYQSLHNDVQPIVMHMVPNSYFHDFLTIKFDATETSQMLASLTAEWSEYNKVRPFEYSFLDETFVNLYWQESRLRKVFFVLSFIAIFISCLGLYALSSYTCALKTKEIGIRKTMGASFGSILVLLSHQFGKMILTAFVISLPVSWYVTHRWLDNFAFHIEPGIGTYLMAGVLAILVGWITISYHTWRTATLNPINTLRHE